MISNYDLDYFPRYIVYEINFFYVKKISRHCWLYLSRAKYNDFVFIKIKH